MKRKYKQTKEAKFIHLLMKKYKKALINTPGKCTECFYTFTWMRLRSCEHIHNLEDICIELRISTFWQH